MAENQILKEKLGGRELKLTDADRRRLAVLGKELGRKLLAKVVFAADNSTALGRILFSNKMLPVGVRL